MAGNPLTDPNWAADIADTVERVVGTVRDRATKPVVHVTRAVVFGLLGAFLGVTAVIAPDHRPDARVAGCSRRGHEPGACGVPQLLHRRRNPLPGRCVGVEKAPLERRLAASKKDWNDCPARSQCDHRRLRPRRADGGDLRGTRQPRPVGDRGRAVEHERPARRPVDADDRRRELPRLPRGDHGARSDAALPRAGGPLRRRVHHREGDQGRPRQPPVPGLGARHRVRGRCDHRQHRRPLPDARPRGRDAPARARPVDVRDV